MAHLTRRFNPLVLAENEDYVHDFAAALSQTVSSDQVLKETSGSQRGRLRVCSKSVIFDPENGLVPLLKFTYANISRLHQTKRSIILIAEKVIEVRMRRLEGKTRMVEAYVTKTNAEKNCWVLEPDFADSSAEFLRINQLWEMRNSPSTNIRAALSLGEKPEFDLTRLNHREGPPLLPTALSCSRVKPLIRHRGLVQVTREAVYFQPVPNFSSKRSVRRIVVADILLVFDRTVGLQDTGLEIITCDRGVLYLCFEYQKDRDLVRSYLPDGNAKDLEGEIKRMMGLWQTGKISNYSYLDFLNCAGGRSINDMSQYPIFPWVLTDYDSETIDLKDPKVYRDLSKPLGALNEKRLQQCIERMDGMPPEERFLYGTHYSTPAYSLFYLLRCLPECMLRLHCGHFDAWSRLFHSVQGAWEATHSSQALMELIPEFFACGKLEDRWLRNELQILTQEGELGNVELPKWAEGDSKKFIEIHRAALESEHVSRHLPLWIDLIFGYKSRGEEAEKANNLFHPVCYLEPPIRSDLSPRSANVLETQIEEFGRVPKQIFKEPHPPRLKIPNWDGDTSKSCWYMLRRNSVIAEIEVEKKPIAGSGPVLLGLCALGPSSSLTSFGPPVALWKGTEKVDYFEKKVYGVGKDGSLKVLELETTHVRTFRASNVPLKALKVISENTVAIAGCDNSVILFSTQSGSTLDSQLLHADSVTALAWSSADNILLSGSLDQMVCVWKIDGPHIRPLTNFDTQESVNTCAIGVGTHNNVVFAGCDGGGVGGWDIRSNDLVFERWEGGDVRDISLCPNSVSACTGEGLMTTWDLRRDQQLYQFSAHKSFSKVHCMLSDSQNWAMIGGEGLNGKGRLSLWDLTEFREQKIFELANDVVIQSTVDSLTLGASGDVRFLQ